MSDITSSINKYLYLRQLQDLEEQVERWQLICEELEKQNKDLVCQYNDLGKVNKDKIEELKSSIVLKEDKVLEMFEQLEDQWLAQKNRKALLEQDHREEEEQLKLIDELQSENANLAAALEAKQEQQISQKQQVSVKEKQELIKSTFNRRNIRLDNLQQTAEGDREAKPLKKTAVTTAKNKKSKKEKEMEDYLPFLLKEKEILNQEKAAQNKRRESFHSSMSNLKKETNTLTQRESALNKKSDKVWHEVQRCFREREKYCDKLQCAQNEADALRQQFNMASEDYRQKVAKKEQLKAELQEEMMMRRQLEGVKQEAAIILRHILMDPQKSSESQWKTQKLVEILKSTAASGNCEDASCSVDPPDPPQPVDSQTGAATFPES